MINKKFMDQKSKLHKKERQKEILEILYEKGYVKVSELSKLFSISDMSIRNDLNDLNRQGKLQRKYGGANTLQISNRELPLTEKHKRNYQEKKMIGRAAAKLIADGDSIMLDAGTTTEHIVPYLHHFHDLTIITNAVNIINPLLRITTVNLYTVGGKVDSKSYSVIGEQAETGLIKYNAKIAFITADGLSFEIGFTNNSKEATNISKILLKNSHTKVMLADSSKIGKIGIFSLCDWEDIDIWVTDDRVPSDFKKQVEAKGVQVIVAER
jgi:DeoR/GlpR family transcriptional regulator of sugar metabolism